MKKSLSVLFVFLVLLNCGELIPKPNDNSKNTTKAPRKKNK
ncbi:hypothetical protein N7U66_11735 [Lacinutrix neustonica]|uniref:Uncharacterized protein n=1 Tax=Lacinutrix neustonica TaxID=2980107 RepID=A0A9E8SFM1_9FLAO|nr:hypothetical protein [Lacinutrix neustonica]WAC00905.1 hypothetical protein N7U66_11735 [Lacinutrix neustonica]